MMDRANNYYEVLEIEPSCSQDELEKAYIRAKNAYTGESMALYSLMSTQDCEQVLENIEEAYSILSIPEKRKEYDKVRGFDKTQVTKNLHQMFSTEDQESGNPFENSPATNKAFVPNAPTDSASTLGVQNFSSGAEEMENRKNFSINRNEVRDISKLSATNRFSLSFNANPEMEDNIENCQSFTGEFLKSIREYKNVDIPRMSNMTRISKTYIKNIENDDFQNLPARPYTRGFVFQYAKVLKLNPDLVANSYMAHIDELKNAK